MSRDKHPVSRNDISKNAIKVLYRLHNSGFEAYLVGGCIRDILLGLEPKDFDVTTNATPEQIKSLFRNCRLIGRRFRLAHVVFGKEVIEVATFRGHHGDSPQEENKKNRTADQDEHGQLVRDNVYGSIEEDAERRDFTANALYYNIADFAIYDFANGVDDINAGILRMIGDPEVRYREDPVRMLRAVRFATKLNMQMDNSVSGPLKELAPLLINIPPARLFDEFLKMFMSGKAEANFLMMKDFGLFQQLFPMLKDYVADEQSPAYQMMLKAFKDTDRRIAEEQRVTPAYLIAVLLWWPLQARREQLENEGGLPPMDALNVAAADVIHRQSQRVSLPKRFSLPARDIWQLQRRLNITKGVRAQKVLEHKRFRAAYDFLLLRSYAENSDKKLAGLAEHWSKAQDNPAQLKSSKPEAGSGRRKPRRRRGPRRKPQENKGNDAT
ncbi:polynucleotide adenylyltransferase PcnB [Idiomarina loihiensis]|uniref:polynucleotide adenylyltransferase PcnB n=1 Tax=Idiomarina TaxID=135575 RepID=UPI000C0EB4BA|nr:MULTISPECIES: polynucleotide adenylyltransferase PcnB [Idiomarina]MRJ45020.1 polynucleotide adenylyltransferase PcnB [Idiomarina loihiensis]PHQ88910.1 MAG: poly(A) polymerase [Idiomarina sp.]UTW34309.1 polynucleotide adenylyltransferase PcnB [Idiomarina loihiensis]